MKKKKVLYRVENIVKKGKIACNKQFLLFSQCFPQLKSSVGHNVVLCGRSNGSKLFKT